VNAVISQDTITRHPEEERLTTGTLDVPSTRLLSRPNATGHGALRINALALIPIGASHSPEADQGELLRCLAEMAWFPTALLAHDIRWDAIDAGSARATISLPTVSCAGYHAAPS
jgi:hypothetical protein